MSTENPDGDNDLPHSPFPDSVVYAWLTFLEALIVALLVVFALGLLEGGEIIPDILVETQVGLGVFIVLFVGLLVFRLRK